MISQKIKFFLDEKVEQYNCVDFIENDPISVPHRYSKKQDIEIAGFLTAILAWGKRVTIIKKSRELLQFMDNSPHDFVLHHSSHDLKAIAQFKHRTFNGLDALYFIHFLSTFYKQNSSLEDAFAIDKGDTNIEKGLIRFHQLFFHLNDVPTHVRKHIATPEKKSACKRINMFLRWMVRHDKKKVDFGLWCKIKPSQLISPCDVHVERVARRLRLIERRRTDWKTALELTSKLKKMDPKDPVKYDFALFGLGIERYF